MGGAPPPPRSGTGTVGRCGHGAGGFRSGPSCRWITWAGDGSCRRPDAGGCGRVRRRGCGRWCGDRVYDNGFGSDVSSARLSNRGHEVIPDEHLSTAIQLVYELMHGSRVYQGGIEWCVGIFLTPGGAPETVVTSNEGAGYVPAGVFLPRSAGLLFADPLADSEFREKWFGQANPVATMVAYAELRRREDGTLPLYALAAGAWFTDTTNLGPAEEAGVEHVHLCHPDAFAVQRIGSW